MDKPNNNPPTYWDANAYYLAGGMPWTFFAYPLHRADADGLPPDERACELLATLQAQGLRVGPFTNGMNKDTAYLGCHKDDTQAVLDMIQEVDVLEYLTARALELFEGHRQG